MLGRGDLKVAARGSTCFASGDLMNRAIRKFRPQSASATVALEALERRQVLSILIATGLAPTIEAGLDQPSQAASPQSRVIVDPGDGAVLPTASAPDAIIAHLDRAAMLEWGGGGLALYRIDAGGSITPVFDAEQPPNALANRADGSVTIPLNAPLGVGRYRVALVGGAGSFSQRIHNGSWDYMEDQTLAEFEVVEDRNEFDLAIDAGTVGTVVQRFEGALAASDDRVLYRVSLGGDQPFWRLGLQLDAKRIDSGLWATLAVYDAQGNIVATSEGRRGFALAADDPHLFVGLEPGDYHVGVMTAEGSERTGAYRLAIVADPAVEPTRVTGFSLDWSRGAPEGFTIIFSDAIAPESLEAVDAPLFAVDERGMAHPAYLTAADGGLRRLSFTFDQPIPPGRYQLVSTGEGGVADLIGRTPTADGLPPGILASWSVAPYQADSEAPETTERSWLDEANRESLIDNAIGPGGALSLRFGAGIGTIEPAGPAPATIERERVGAPAPGAVERESGSAPAPGADSSSSFIGVLDSGLVGRPVAREDGTAIVGPIPAEGRLHLANAARERLLGPSSAPGWADGGLVRSSEGVLEMARRDSGSDPTAISQAPSSVEFRNVRRVSNIADAEALKRMENDRLAAASAGLVRWLFGLLVRDGGGQPEIMDQDDPRLLAGTDADASPGAVETTDGRPAEGGVSRAGLGVPIGLIIGVAVAHRFHRRPPRWWLRRSVGKTNGASTRPVVPRGPQSMIPPRPVFQRIAQRRRTARR